MQVRLARAVTSTETILGSIVTVPNVTHTANSYVWLRVQAAGTNPTTLRIKAWADGQAEPAAWLVTTTDATPSLQTAGTVGLRAYVPTGSTNSSIRFSFDDLQVRGAKP